MLIRGLMRIKLGSGGVRAACPDVALGDWPAAPHVALLLYAACGLQHDAVFPRMNPSNIQTLTMGCKNQASLMKNGVRKLARKA